MRILTILIKFMAIPLVLVLLGLMISWKINFSSTLSKGEKDMQTFSFDNVSVVPEQPAAEIKNLDSPLPLEVKVTVAKKGFPQVPLSKIAMPKDKKQEEPEEVMRLSAILSGQGKRTAMINGLLVSEGDHIRENKIEKIEKNRVLIKNKKGERWIAIE